MRERIERARKMQEKRYAGTEYRFNGDVSSADVDHYCSLGETEKMSWNSCTIRWN